MKIIVDDREHKLMEQLSMLFSLSNPTTFSLVKQTLILGDIVLTRDTPDVGELCIIERKSLQDLLASVKDGRYEEQSHRLTHASNCPNHRIVYIIEGLMSSLRTPQEKKIVYSAITSLNLYKGFSVMRTATVNETAVLIYSMMNKIINNDKRGVLMYNEPRFSTPSTESINMIEQVDPPNYCSVVKKVKKDNITTENIGEIILSQIPGVSSAIAISIMSNFDSFYHLIESLQKDNTCLENLTITTNDKTRKISKKALENIVHHLMSTKDEKR
jgi:ERCC4-type nuclease